MTDRWPATYGPSTITSQPNTRSKNASRTTVALTPAETRILGLLPMYRTLAPIRTQLAAGRPIVRTHVEARFHFEVALARVHSDARRIVESGGLIKEFGQDQIDDTVRRAVGAVSGKPAHTGGG